MAVYSYYYFLPSVSAVLAWGSYGVYYKFSQNPISDNYDIKPYLIMAMAAGGILTAYNYYRCTVRRRIAANIMEEPPAIS
jgi:hypothetical protein